MPERSASVRRRADGGSSLYARKRRPKHAIGDYYAAIVRGAAELSDRPIVEGPALRKILHVIIWLNGPFGIGKTSAAERIVERLSDGLIYDPELIGAMLRRIVGRIDPVEDYQDLRLWRTLVVEIARQLRRKYSSILVMPMTVWRRDYFNELLAGLRDADPNLRCFRLVASEGVLRARIMDRPSGEGPHDWCLAHLQIGLELMGDTTFGEGIHTDGLSPAQVADQILAAVGRPLNTG